MISLGRFFVNSLSTTVQRWNVFWFEYSSTLSLGVVRVFFGLWAAMYAVAWLVELPTLIGSNGVLDTELTRYLIGVGEPGTGSLGRLSILYWLASPSSVQAYLIVLIVGGIAMASGLGGRWMVLMAFLLLLGIAHRVPMLQGPGDLMLIGMFGYLFVDPGKRHGLFRIGLHDNEHRASANLVTRLLQVHFIVWMIATFLSCIAEPMWWNGSATWWLAVAGRSAWWTRNALVDHPYFVNFVTHLYLVILALMPVLLTRQGCRTRGITLGLVLAWLTYGLCGDLIYTMSLIVALSSFVGDLLSEWKTTIEVESLDESNAKSSLPNVRQLPKKRSRPGLARS